MTPHGKLDHGQVGRLFLKALNAGATRHSLTTCEWDLAGKCQRPVYREIWQRPPKHLIGAEIGTTHDGEVLRTSQKVAQAKHIIVGRHTKTPLCVRLWVRCRRCDKCLARRAMRWQFAAKSETGEATRTWFGTLTLSPEEQFLALTRARAKLAVSGVDYDALPFGEQFGLLVGAINPIVTKYLKRVRKESGVPLRYLIVAERHKSGLPHFHMLVHERVAGACVKERTLSKQWRAGFSKWRLVHDVRQATYLCKYLSKTLAARVRASQGYGKTASAIATYVACNLTSPLVRPRTRKEANNGLAAGLPQVGPVVAARLSTVATGDATRPGPATRTLSSADAAAISAFTQSAQARWPGAYRKNANKPPDPVHRSVGLVGIPGPPPGPPR